MSDNETLEDALKWMGEKWWEEEQRHRADLKTCPDNGRRGTWVMEDDRHRVEVEAESAPEVFEKAHGLHSWWAWDIYFLGSHD